MLGGAETFVDFVRFGQAKVECLKTILEPPSGIPSRDPFGRVFAMLDPEQFYECFRNWTQSLRVSVEGKVVAIDAMGCQKKIATEIR